MTRSYKIKRPSGYTFTLDLSPNWQPIIKGKERPDLGVIASSEAEAVNRVQTRLDFRQLIRGGRDCDYWEQGGRLVSKIVVEGK